MVRRMVYKMKTELNKHSPVLLNAFDDAEEALRTALECMDGQSMELADIRQCLDDLYECRTHLRPR